METKQRHLVQLRVLIAIALVFVAAVAAGALYAPKAQAASLASQPLTALEADIEVEVDGVQYRIWADDNLTEAGSVSIKGCKSGTTQLIVPSSVTYQGKTISLENSFAFIDRGTFKGNSELKSVVLPKFVHIIGDEAFMNCTALETVVLEGVPYDGSLDEYEGKIHIGKDAFAGCPNLKNYYFGKNIDDNTIAGLDDSGVAQDKGGEDGTVYPDVTFDTVKDSPAENYANDVNKKGGEQVKVVHDPDPYKTGLEKVNPDVDPKPATPFSPGATEKEVNKALIKYAKEADPKGSQFILLRANGKKVTAKSIKLAWTKAKGAVKYVIYGNKCGSKNKMVKLKTTKKNNLTFKKVNGKAVKKGTYYKFIVVAFDKSNKVVSTSKTVHAATSGGKVGNDKKVTTAAKKGKVSIKVKKSFNLKAKEVPQSKKLKVKRHRKVAYESSNPSIATVSKKGIVKGKSKGTCLVYAYAQNGMFAKVKVTVK